QARHILDEAEKREAIGKLACRSMGLQLRSERSLSRDEESRLRALIEHEAGRIDQVAIALLLLEPGHAADREVLRSKSQRPTSLCNDLRILERTKLLQGRTEVDHLDLLRANLANRRREVGRAARDGERDVGQRFQRTIGKLLIPGRIDQVAVF